MAGSLNTAQKAVLTAGYVDANGSANGVTPPANDTFTWSINAPDGSATLDATSGATVNLIAQAVGSGTVTLSDAANLPAATLDYTVTADVATGLTITMGTPVAK